MHREPNIHPCDHLSRVFAGFCWCLVWQAHTEGCDRTQPRGVCSFLPGRCYWGLCSLNYSGPLYGRNFSREVPRIIVLFLINWPVPHKTDYFLPLELIARQPGTNLGSTPDKAQSLREHILYSQFLTFSHLYFPLALISSLCSSLFYLVVLHMFLQPTLNPFCGSENK